MLPIKKLWPGLLVALVLLLGLPFSTAAPVEASAYTTQVIPGSRVTLVSNATRYIPMYGGWLSATEGHVNAPCPTNVSISFLSVELSAAPAGVQSYAFTLMVNGSPSALTCTVTGAATTASDTTHSVSITAGNLIDIKVVGSATAAASAAWFSTVSISTTANESILLASTSDTIADGRYYSRATGGRGTAYISATENDQRQVCPAPGTLKKLYVKLSEAVANNDYYYLTLRVNAYDSTLKVTIYNTASTGSDTVNTVAVVAGNVLTMEWTSTSSPTTTPYVSYGMVFSSTNDGESIVMGGTDDTMTTGTTEYNAGTGFLVNWSATEANFYTGVGNCTAYSLYVLLSGTPGAGKSYAFSLRQNGGSVLTATVSDTATTANSGVTTVALVTGNDIDIMYAPSGTPTARDAYWGYVLYINPVTSNTPDSKAFGTVATGSTNNTGLDYFTITNNSGFAVNITISGTDFTGGTTWTLSDTAEPGADTLGLTAGLEGGSYNIIIKKTAAYNTLKAGLASYTTQKWGFSLLMPTSTSDGVEKSGTITLIVAAA